MNKKIVGDQSGSYEGMSEEGEDGPGTCNVMEGKEGCISNVIDA